MKLIDIKTKTIRNINNKELLRMHHRCHQLYSIAKKRNNIKLKNLVIKKHSIIVQEMKRRKMNHKTPLIELYLFFLNNRKLKL